MQRKLGFSGIFAHPGFNEGTGVRIWWGNLSMLLVNFRKFSIEPMIEYFYCLLTTWVGSTSSSKKKLCNNFLLSSTLTLFNWSWFLNYCEKRIQKVKRIFFLLHSKKLQQNCNNHTLRRIWLHPRKTLTTSVIFFRSFHWEKSPPLFSCISKWFLKLMLKRDLLQFSDFWLSKLRFPVVWRCMAQM